ncbi:RidA family protein [Vogesella facilis]|uniref:RidA family protein n=1 Tax=Vogesella facilis TaxID=1655232 RepID=A0ABV7RMV4_9NEIS
MSIHRHLPGKRMSEAVIVNGLIYTVQVPESGQGDARAQTAETLALVDKVLAELGSDKTRIIEATIFMPDLNEFDQMNEAWDAWVAEGHAPVRCTVGAKLAHPDWKLEIRIVAAV